MDNAGKEVYEFPALSVVLRVGNSRYASETDNGLFFLTFYLKNKVSNNIFYILFSIFKRLTLYLGQLRAYC